MNLKFPLRFKLMFKFHFKIKRMKENTFIFPMMIYSTNFNLFDILLNHIYIVKIKILMQIKLGDFGVSK